MLTLEYHTKRYGEEEVITIDIVSTVVTDDTGKAILLGMGSNGEVVSIALSNGTIRAYDTNLAITKQPLPIGSRDDIKALLKTLDTINIKGYRDTLTNGEIEYVIGITGKAYAVVKLFEVVPKGRAWDSSYYLVADNDRVYKHVYNNTVDDIKIEHMIVDHDELEEELSNLHRDSVVTELDLSSVNITELLYV